MRLPVPGSYTAVAVEWSGLESPQSLPFALDQLNALRVLEEVPQDFSWTQEVWTVDSHTVSRDQAMEARSATLEIQHLYDGLIAREQWKDGKRTHRIDLNDNGKPIRHQEFQHGKLKNRYFINTFDLLVSEEFYGEDGAKTEYIKYYASPDYSPGIVQHWWYDHGRPVKYVKEGKVEFDANRSD